MSKASEMQALSTSDELTKSPGAPEVNIPRDEEPEIQRQRLVEWNDTVLGTTMKFLSLSLEHFKSFGRAEVRFSS